MKLYRRSVLAGAVALSASPKAFAQAYPNKPIKIVVPFAAGSATDLTARGLAAKLQELLKQPIVVDDKPGASGQLGASAVATAPADGYTLLMGTNSTNAANQALFKKPPFDASLLRVAATINRQAFMLAVSPNSPYMTVADLTKAMKAKGDKASYGSNSTQSRIAGSLYKKAENLDAVEVQYKAGPDTIKELNSGALDFSFQDPQMASMQAQQGRLRLLAVCSGTRMDMAPTLPTMAELGYPQFNLIGWFAATVQADTPAPIVEQINKWFAAVLATQETKEFLTGFGSDVWVNNSQDAQAFFRKDLATWQENVTASGIERQ